MVAASKPAPSTAAQFVAFFESLRKTEDVPERLILLGLATRGDDGKIVLRDDVREPFEALEKRLEASLDAGMTPREAVAAAALDVDHRKVTHVVYGLFVPDGGPGLYVGETSQTMAARFGQHPSSCCPKLLAAMENTGGKGAWECAVLLVLPEEARSKEMLLYIEARIQKLLDTVDGAHGLNCHYGAGKYGGAPDEVSWIVRYVELIEFVAEHGKLPSQTARDADEKMLGSWANEQRFRRGGMSTHRRRALEALGSAWKWRINAPPVTNSTLFEKLYADGRVISSCGMNIPIDIVGAQRLDKARRHFRSETMSEFDRATVIMDFPGLTMTARNASFWLNARAFAEAHPGAKTSPSSTKERALYEWMKFVKDGSIDTNAPWRKNVLEDFGLGALFVTRKSENVRAANIMRIKASTIIRNTERSVARAEARESKKRKKREDVAVGTPSM